MTRQTKAASLAGALESLLAQVEASEKSAEANTEAGGYQGSTTHPVKNVDDGTQTASEGARSSENSTDVKADQGAAGVDSTSAGTPGGQDSVQTDIGITSKATGEDPASEDSYKSTKDDPGSSHPARTDNNSLDGEKYSSADFRNFAKQADEIGQSLLALIAVSGEKQASGCGDGGDMSTGAGETKKKEDAPADAGKEAVAAQAGYDLAGIFAGMADVSAEDKQAADRMVVETLHEVLAMADRRAEKLANYYIGLAEAEAEKSAEGMENFEEGGSEEGDPAAAESSPEEEAAMAGGEGGGSDEELLAALLGGGENMGAEEAMADMTGGDAGGMEAGMGGGMPAEAGMPPEAGAPAEGGMPEEGLPEGDPTMGQEEALMAVLQQMGIEPEQLTQMMQGKTAAEIIQRVNRKMAAEKAASAKNTKKPKTAGDAKLLRATQEVIREIASRG